MTCKPRIAIPTLLLSVALLAACAVPGEGSQAAVGAKGTPVEDSGEPAVRIAPDFTLPRIGGGEISLADTSGMVRLVEFWATWCPPCREEIPMLNELQQKYRSRGFVILAISSESASVIEEFLFEHPVIYTNLVGTEDLEQEYGAVGLPTGFLIDGEGRVAEVYFGAKPRRVLKQKIEELLDAS